MNKTAAEDVPKSGEDCITLLNPFPTCNRNIFFWCCDISHLVLQMPILLHKIPILLNQGIVVPAKQLARGSARQLQKCKHFAFKVKITLAITEPD